MTLQELSNILGAAATVLGIVGTFARAIPAQTWARWERDLPRVANSLRFARAVGPDVLKALRAAWAVVRGTPWGARVAPAVDAVDAALPRETATPASLPIAFPRLDLADYAKQLRDLADSIDPNKETK